VKLAIGISTPAVSGSHWDRIPPHYWDYFARAFRTSDMASTRLVTEQLSLFGVMNNVKCPVYLFHGGRDTVSQPDALALFYRETTQAPLTVTLYPKSGHCCLDKLLDDALPAAVKWTLERI